MMKYLPFSFLCYLVLLLAILPNTNADDLDVEQCKSYFSLTTYANTTKGVEDLSYKLGLVGSWTASNMVEKVSMIKFAVDYINNMSTILPDVALDLVGAEIEGVQTNTLLAALATVQSKARLIIGGTSDGETDGLYALAARYQLPQIAPFSNSDKYASSSAYPNLIHIAGSSQQQVTVLPGILNHLGWKRCIVLIGDDDNGKNAYNYFTLAPYAKLFHNISYTIITAPAAASSDTATVRTLNNTMTQTFVVAMCTPLATAVRLMPKLFAAGLVSPKFVYIMCDQVAQGIQNNPSLLGTAAPYFNGTIMYAPKGLGFTPLYDSMLNLWNEADRTKYPGARPPSPNTWAGFEAVYLAATSLDLLVREGFHVDNITTKQIRDTMENANYQGVTGPVAFNLSSGVTDRLGYWDVFNYYDRKMIYKFSMSYSDATVPYDVQEGNFTFYGGRTDIPEDYIRKTEYNGTAQNATAAPTAAPFEDTYRDYNVGISAAFGAVTGVGTCIAIFSSLVLVTKPQEYKTYGRFFSGVVNGGTFIALAGALTLLPRRTDALCIAFPWLVGIGFNIVYGILLLKMCKLFSATRNSSIKWSPSQKSIGILCFVLIESVLQIIWTVIYAQEAEYVKLRDSTYELQCHNDEPIFWGIFIGYKGLWVLGGTILAIVTRRRSSSEVPNVELKSISFAIFNLMGMFIIGVPVGVGLSKIPSGTTIIAVALVVLAFTFTLFILFFDIWFNIFFAHKDIVGQASKSMEMMTKKQPGTGSTGTGNSGSRGSQHSTGGKNSGNQSKQSKGSGSAHSASISVHSST